MEIIELHKKSKGIKQTKVTSFFSKVDPNAEKDGPSCQKSGKLTMPCSIKISKPPLKELDEGQEVLELLSDED